MRGLNLLLLTYQLASVINHLISFPKRAAAGTGWQHFLHNCSALLLLSLTKTTDCPPARNSEFDKQEDLHFLVRILEEFEKNVYQICNIYFVDETGACLTEFQNLKVTL
jgi:hypothetical protein